ncbi:MAG TPA: hypothetical protein VK988_13730 [Acidimicrobiales bacterium]|nr:hypothetical protein [Acidimicrobiales bacterium]
MWGDNQQVAQETKSPSSGQGDVDHDGIGLHTLRSVHRVGGGFGRRNLETGSTEDDSHGGAYGGLVFQHNGPSTRRSNHHH